MWNAILIGGLIYLILDFDPKTKDLQIVWCLIWVLWTFNEFIRWIL